LRAQLWFTLSPCLCEQKHSDRVSHIMKNDLRGKISRRSFVSIDSENTIAPA
jgi:hypothetical protein